MKQSLQLFDKKQNQFFILLALWFFSSFISSFFLFQNHTLYLDSRLMYGYYFNIMHSLNDYGEPAWWFPNHQYGIPGYLLAMIGVVNAANPIFIFVGTIFWILGLIGVHVGTILPSYIVVLYFVIPLVFLLSVWSLSRQFFKVGLPVVLMLVTTAFSPAIFQNLKDPGFLEITAYGLFFLSALIQFMKTGNDRDFLWLALMSFVLAVSAGFSFVVWNFWFLGVSLALSLVLYPRWRKLCKKRLLEQGIKKLSWVGLGIFICLIPKILTYMKFRGEILRNGMGSGSYPFERIHAGNPWQFILSSVPGIGFRNLPGGDFTHFVAAPDAFWPHPSYLGLLGLPLILFGFLYGRPVIRNIFVSVIAVIYLVILPGPSSPLLLLLFLVPPIRAMNHYFDLVHGFGGSVLLIFGIGLGLETILLKPQHTRKFLLIFALSSVFSIFFFTQNFTERKVVLGSFSGLYCLLTFLLGSFVWQLSQSCFTIARKTRLIWISVLSLVLIDVSASHWAFVRIHLAPLETDQLDQLAPNGLGTSDPRVTMGLEKAFFLRTSHELQDLGGDRLPETAFYSKYHSKDFVTSADLDTALKSHEPSIQVDGFENPQLKLSEKIGSPSAKLRRLSYNRFDVEVSGLESPALMMIRDTYFPGWRAEANGEEIPILKALGGVKLVKLTPEMKTIHFRFLPTATAYTLLMAYVLIIAATGYYFSPAFRRSSQIAKQNNR